MPENREYESTAVSTNGWRIVAKSSGGSGELSECFLNCGNWIALLKRRTQLYTESHSRVPPSFSHLAAARVLCSIAICC